jgi:hypothetical protein
VRIVGIGRNEYIATMNKCKGKKLLWRVNKAIVREHLPAEPLPLEKQPWWLAHVVNLGAAIPWDTLAGQAYCQCTLCQLACILGVSHHDYRPQEMLHLLSTSCNTLPLVTPVHATGNDDGSLQACMCLLQHHGEEQPAKLQHNNRRGRVGG